MKISFQLNLKSSFQVISALTALAVFSGCPSSGGGGKSDTPPPAVAISGIQGNGECTAETLAIYNSIRNNAYNSQAYAQVRSECARLTSLLGSQSCRVTNQNAVIRVTDVQYQCSQANGSTGTITNPGTTNPNIPTKNVLCSIDLTSGSAAGSIANMPVQVFANGGEYRLYANMQNTKTYWGGFLNYTKYFSSERLTTLKLKFKAGNAATADTLSLSADLKNGKSASATGFAGSEVRIEILGETEQDTSLIVSCTGQDQFNAGPALNGSNIRCSMNENDNGKKSNIKFVNSVSDLENLGIYPSKTSNLVLEGSGQNMMSTSVTPTTAYEAYKVVTSLVSPSTVKIKAPGYSLDSTCSLQ